MQKKSTRNELRIIGGRWRSRRIRFAAQPGIRPTPDRVRETLFNWLQHEIAGSRCLDLFAGSGALGLEALSRGAAEVTFVERDRIAARHLREALALLGGANAQIKVEDARRFLEGPSAPFDIVFLDPPFGEDCLAEICAALEERGWLAGTAHIYIEAPSRGEALVLPQRWTLLKAQRAGAVGYHLARRELAPGGNK